MYALLARGCVCGMRSFRSAPFFLSSLSGFGLQSFKLVLSRVFLSSSLRRRARFASARPVRFWPLLAPSPLALGLTQIFLKRLSEGCFVICVVL